MNRTSPRSKKVAAAPVATTRPSVATMTQSFESQATPPAMGAVPATAIHHFQGEIGGLPCTGSYEGKVSYLVAACIPQMNCLWRTSENLVEEKFAEHLF